MAHPVHRSPGYFGEDLDQTAQQAFEEGQDADTHIDNKAVPIVGKASPRSTNAPDTKLDLEKGLNVSSNPSLSDLGHGEVNNEKAGPITAQTETENPNLVFWDGPDDPANPMNWTMRKKGTNIAILSLLTLITPLASSMFAPGVPQCMHDFNSSSQTLATFVVSVYILGFAVGPLVIAPLSELYGRLPVYHVCNAFYIAFTVGCALANNLNALIAFRFLAGCFGVAPLTIGSGTIADMVRIEKRGAAMAIWAMGPLLGPVIGPVVGGFLATAKGWRWIFWLLTMCSGAVAVAALLFLRESYHPALLAQKTKRLQKETGNTDLRSKLDSGQTPRDLFIRSIVRPTKMLLFSPIVLLMSIYMSVVYGILYLLFTTFTYVFEDSYGFSQSTVGLVYLGTGIGMLVGLALLGFSSDRILKRLTAKNGGKTKPEFRLPPLMLLGGTIPVGLFIYGWTAQHHIQWAVPLLGTLLVGIGLIAAFMCIQTYLVDAYTEYAASAIAANTVLRSIFGAVLPLAGLKMYAALGLGWGNSLLGFLSLALVPIPFFFYYKGEMVRTHPRFQLNL